MSSAGDQLGNPNSLLSAYLLISNRCLAHIINLAAQAVISTRSKSKYYNGDLADDHLPEDLSANERDEIGIVWAICVKVGTLFLVQFLY